MLAALGLAATPAAWTACTSGFADATAIVTSPRLLAVQASPAEAPTGSSFALKPLYVGPSGPADASAIAWDLCLLQKPLGDPDPVNPACISGPKPGVVAVGRGATVTATVPADACELFGPSSPPPTMGQPAARPTDPDSTGGFYLPLTVTPSGQPASLAQERITCAPSGVTQPVFSAFENGYQPNENPDLQGLSTVDADGGATPISAAAPAAPPGLIIEAGGHVTLEASWPPCPSSPCAGAETFLLVDPTTKQLTTQRESIVASFYATAGTFDLDRVGRDSSDLATSVQDGWTAPGSPMDVTVWVVVRDSRGGVGWGTFAFGVR
jgi:hypothetical protein